MSIRYNRSYLKSGTRLFLESGGIVKEYTIKNIRQEDGDTVVYDAITTEDTGVIKGVLRMYYPSGAFGRY